MAGKRKCAFVKPDGTTCRATATTSGDYFFFHDPAKAQARKDARSKGGKGSGKASHKVASTLPANVPAVDVEDVAGVVKLLGETINGVRAGTTDPKIANATGYLASVLLRALEGSELAKQIEEQAAQLAALKNDMETMRRERRHLQKAAGPSTNGDRGITHGNGQQSHPGRDPGGPGGNPDDGGDDAGLLADDVAPFFQ